LDRFSIIPMYEGRAGWQEVPGIRDHLSLLNDCSVVAYTIRWPPSGRKGVQESRPPGRTRAVLWSGHGPVARPFYRGRRPRPPLAPGFLLNARHPRPVNEYNRR
jgi:hypothetical protein